MLNHSRFQATERQQNLSVLPENLDSNSITLDGNEKEDHNFATPRGEASQLRGNAVTRNDELIENANGSSAQMEQMYQSNHSEAKLIQDKEEKGLQEAIDKIPEKVKKLLKQRNFQPSRNSTNELIQFQFQIDSLKQQEDILKEEIKFEEEEDYQQVNLEMQSQAYLNKKEKLPKCVFKHNGPVRVRWDLLIIILALYNCVMVPIGVAFSNLHFEDSIGMQVIDRVIDILFFLDVVFNFRTTFISSKTGLLVQAPKRIAANYILKGRFFVDVLASIPFELLLEPIFEQNTKQLKVIGLIKLVRLLRLGRIITFLKMKQSFKLGLRIFQALFVLVLIDHWIACIWYIIVNQNQIWLPAIDLDPPSPENFYNATAGEQYMKVLYYSVLLMVGNDAWPHQRGEVIYFTAIVLLGALCMSFIFSNITTVMGSMNKKESRLTEQLDMIQTTMKTIKLPEVLQDEVFNYLMQIQDRPEVNQDLGKFFDLLSPAFKAQVLQFLHFEVLHENENLQEASDIEVTYLVNKLHTLLYLPTDDIVKQGDPGKHLFFISAGAVQVLLVQEVPLEDYDKVQGFQSPFQNQESGGHARELEKKRTSVSAQISQIMGLESSSLQERVVDDLGKGEYFGEIALITNMKRTATVRATDYCTLASISSQDFTRTEEEFPQIFLNFKSRMSEYGDPDTKFRMEMIQTVPYFRKLKPFSLRNLMYLLRQSKYDANTLIIKRGDITDNIYMLKEGVIEVEVPFEGKTIHFDFLPPGSCFCTYSAFDAEMKQILNFKARTLCVVEVIKIDDLYNLAKQFIDINDVLKSLEVEIKSNDKTDFDFFRFRRHAPELSYQQKKMIKLQFRRILTTFIQDYKLGLADQPKALKAIAALQKERKHFDHEIRAMKLEQSSLYKNCEPSLRRSQRSNIFFQDSNNVSTNKLVNSKRISMQSSFEKLNPQNLNSLQQPQFVNAKSQCHSPQHLYAASPKQSELLIQDQRESQPQERFLNKNDMQRLEQQQEQLNSLIEMMQSQNEMVERLRNSSQKQLDQFENTVEGYSQQWKGLKENRERLLDQIRALQHQQIQFETQSDRNVQGEPSKQEGNAQEEQRLKRQVTMFNSKEITEELILQMEQAQAEDRENSEQNKNDALGHLVKEEEKQRS